MRFAPEMGLMWLSLGTSFLVENTRPVCETLARTPATNMAANIGTAADSAVCLELRDINQRARIRLCVSPQAGPLLEMLDTTGSALVALGSQPDSPAFLRLNDGRHVGTDAARLWLDDRGRPELELVDARPECTARLRAGVDAAPRLELHNWDAAPGGLILYDSRDQARAGLLVQATGVPALSFLDAEGRPVSRRP